MLIFLFHEVFLRILGIVLLAMFIALFIYGIRTGYITLPVWKRKTEKEKES